MRCRDCNLVSSQKIYSSSIQLLINVADCQVVILALLLATGQLFESLTYQFFIYLCEADKWTLAAMA